MLARDFRTVETGATEKGQPLARRIARLMAGTAFFAGLTVGASTYLAMPGSAAAANCALDYTVNDVTISSYCTLVIDYSQYASNINYQNINVDTDIGFNSGPFYVGSTGDNSDHYININLRMNPTGPINASSTDFYLSPNATGASNAGGGGLFIVTDYQASFGNIWVMSFYGNRGFNNTNSKGDVYFKDFNIVMGGWAESYGNGGNLYANNLFMGDSGEWSGTNKKSQNRLDLLSGNFIIDGGGSNYIGFEAPAQINASGSGKMEIKQASNWAYGASVKVDLQATDNPGTSMITLGNAQMAISGGSIQFDIATMASWKTHRWIVDQKLNFNTIVLGDGSSGTSAIFNYTLGNQVTTEIKGYITAPYIKNKNDFRINVTGPGRILINNQTGTQPFLSASSGSEIDILGGYNGGLDISGMLYAKGRIGFSNTDFGTVTIKSGGVLNIDEYTITNGDFAMQSGSKLSMTIGGSGNTISNYENLKIQGTFYEAGTLYVDATDAEYDFPYHLIESENWFAAGGFDNIIVVDNAVGGFGTGKIGVNYKFYRNHDPYPGSFVLILFEPPAGTFVFWNGNTSTPTSPTGNGGNGTWSLTDTNWASDDGILGNWNNGDLAYFAGANGTVNVSSSDGISFYGMNVTSNYTIQGGSLTLSNTNLETGDPISQVVIFVDDKKWMRINSALIGASNTIGIQKTGTGTLILGSDSNSYRGGTLISDGEVMLYYPVESRFSGPGTLTFDSSVSGDFYLTDIYSGMLGEVNFSYGDFVITQSASGFTGHSGVNNGATMNLNNNRLAGTDIGVWGIVEGVGQIGTYSSGWTTLKGDGTLQPGSGTASGQIQIVSGDGFDMEGGTLIFTSLSATQTSSIRVNGTIKGSVTIKVTFQGNPDSNVEIPLIIYGSGNFNLNGNSVYSTVWNRYLDASEYRIVTNYNNQFKTVLIIEGSIQNQEYYWNGTYTSPNSGLHGGSGTWNTTSQNWTDSNGAKISKWQNGKSAMFTTSPGTVNVQSYGISAAALEFKVSNYVLTGYGLGLSSLNGGDALIEVVTGTAKIDNQLTSNVRVTKSGSGELVLTAGNSSFNSGFYLQEGQLTLANGAFSGAITGGSATTLALSPTNSTYTFANDITGYNGTLLVGGSTVTMTGSNASFTGKATVNSSTNFIIKAGLGGTITVNTGQLTGTGTIGSKNTTLTMADSTSLAVGSTKFMTIGGSLSLSAGTTSIFNIDQYGSDLIDIVQDFTAQGKVKVNFVSTATSGIYPLFNYDGSLSQYSLTLDSGLPSGNTYDLISATAAKQVLLVVQVSGTAIEQYWNGSMVAGSPEVVGGNGTWNLSQRNWTNSQGYNATIWADSPTLPVSGIFAGTMDGTVVVQSDPGAPIYVSTLKFNANSYIFQGDALDFYGDGTDGAGNVYITVASGESATFDLTLGGLSSLQKDGDGTLVFAQPMTYSGGQTNILAGTFQLGDPLLGNGSLKGAIALSDNTTLAIVVSGAVPVDFQNTLTGSASTTFNIEATSAVSSLKLWADNSSFAGTTTLSSGVLTTLSNGAKLGGVVNVEGGTLAGTGSYGSSGTTVTVGSSSVSVLSPGDYNGNPSDIVIGTITIAGNMVVGASTTSYFQVAIPGVIGGANNDLVAVAGDLTLAGGTEIIILGKRRGYYYLMTYDANQSGAPGQFDPTKTKITFDGTALDPSQYTFDYTGGYVRVQVSTVHTGELVYWDGNKVVGSGLAATGGDGTWTSASSNMNWTDAAATSLIAWGAGDNAVFAGSAGTVTVNTTGSGMSAIEISGLQFETTGYVLAPTASGNDKLTISPTYGHAYIFVEDPNDATNAAFKATVGVEITGDGSVTKDGSGLLVMTHDATYTGVTDVIGGTLQLGDGLSKNASLPGEIAIGGDSRVAVYAKGTGVSFANTLRGTGAIQFSGTASDSATFSGDGSQFLGSIIAAGGGLTVISEMSGKTLIVGLDDANYPGTLGPAKMTLGAGARVAISSSALIGDSASQAAEFDINSGGSLRVNGSPGISISFYSGANATVNVSGTASFMIADEGSISVAAENSTTATLTVSDGGLVSTLARDLAIGTHDDSRGEVIVSGTSSSLRIVGDIYLASPPDGSGAGSASLILGSEASVTSGQAGAGEVTANQILFGTPTASGVAELVFNHNGTASQSYKFGVDLVSAMTPTTATSHSVKQMAGFTTFHGDGSKFLGETLITGGTFNALGNLTGTIIVDGGTLSGIATVGSPAITLYVGQNNASTLSPGDLTSHPAGAPNYGTLNILGNLKLEQNASSVFEVSVPNVTAGDPGNDLVAVLGDGNHTPGQLTLNGTLVVHIDSGQYGTYTLFTSGNLQGTYEYSDITVYLGSVATRAFTMSYPNDSVVINVIEAPTGGSYYWNGPDETTPVTGGQGGTGTWNTVGNHTNWTDETAVLPWVYPNTAVFGGVKGTVSVDDSEGIIEVMDIEFQTSGYELVPLSANTPSALTLRGSGATATITVGGANGSASDTAKIDVVLISNITTVKDGPGTLTLTANNQIASQFQVQAGSLQLGDGVSNGTLQGPIALMSSTSNLTVTATGNVNFINTLTSSSRDSQFNVLGSGGTADIVAYTADSSGFQGDAFVYNGVSLNIQDGILSAGSLTIGEDYNGNAGANAAASVTVSGDGQITTADIYLGYRSVQAEATLNIGAAETDSPAAAGQIAPNTTIQFGGGPNPTLVFNHSSFLFLDDITLTVGREPAPDAEIKIVNGYTVFGGIYTTGLLDKVSISGGTLALSKDSAGRYTSSLSASLVDVQSGGHLTGHGTIMATVTVESGGLLTGTEGDNSPTSLLDIAGTLTFDQGSTFIAEIEHDTDNTYALIDVSTLQATSAVSLVIVAKDPLQGIAAGEHLLISSSTPISQAVLDAFVPTNPIYTVGYGKGGTTQLVVNVSQNVAPASIFWHPSLGSNFGNTGVWNTSTTNWTDQTGANHTVWDQGYTAVFQGDAGTVTVDSSSPSSGAIKVGGFKVMDHDFDFVANALTDELLLQSQGGAPIKIDVATSLTASFDVPLAQSAAATPVEITGGGTVELKQRSTYRGGTEVLDASTLRLAFNGTVSSTIVVNDGAVVEVLSSGTVTFDSGVPLVRRNVGGTKAAFNINGGTAQINSNSSGFDGNTTVAASGTLTGDGGNIGGAVTVQKSGTLANTVRNETFTVGDTLTLQSGSILGVTLDPVEPNYQTPLFTTDTLLVDTTGTVTVDVQTTNGTSVLRQGDYLLLTYTTWSAQNLLNLQASNGDLLFVNTVNGVQGLYLQSDGIGALDLYWNPKAGTNLAQFGGDGVWTPASGTAWSNEKGLNNEAWQQAAVAIFDGQTGTVSVNSTGSIIEVAGMRFNQSMTISPQQGASDAILTLAGGFASGTYVEVLNGRTATINVELTGSSGIAKYGAGELVLNSNNTYSGDTQVFAGTLTTLSEKAVPGDIDLKPEGSNTATWNWKVTASASGGLSSNYSGVISGSGTINKQSALELELSGNSSGFTGTTNVMHGTLSVASSGSLGGKINVQSGATITGTGTFGDIDLLSEGTFNYGDGTVGSVTNVTSLVTEAGSNMIVHADFTGITSGQKVPSSKINVSGDLTANGGNITTNIVGGLPIVGSYLVIAEVGGTATETVGWTTQPGSPSFKFAPEFPAGTAHPNEIWLKVVKGRLFTECTVSANGCSVTRAVEAFLPTPEKPTDMAVVPLTNAVMGMQDDEVDDALGQLSGDAYASANAAMVANSQYLRAATGAQIRQATGGITVANDMSTATNYAAEAPLMTPFGPFEETQSGINVWFTGYGSWSRIEGDGNAATITDNVGGMFIGADAAVGADMRFGALVGYGQSSYDVDARQASGSSNDFTLGAYGGGSWGGFGVDFGTAYTWHDVSAERRVNFSTLNETLRGDYNAGTFQAYGSVGYTFDLGNGFQLEPYADAAYINQQSGAFDETGGAAALSHLDSTMNTWFTTLGVRTAWEFQLGQTANRVSLSAGWRHGYGDLDPAEQLSFTGGDFFSITGAPLARDQGVVSAGWETQITDMVSIGINYSGQFGGGNESQNVTGKLNIRF